MRRLWQQLWRLPLALRIPVVFLATAVVLVLLVVLFEWAGNLLDTGGVVGA